MVKVMPIERQHFVPQGFLKGFSDPEHPSGKMIWKYEKKYNNPPKQVSVKSIAWRSFYYAQEFEGGEADTDTIETWIAKNVDNEIPKIIQQIETKPGKKLMLSDEQTGALAFFLGLSLTRVPSFRDGINDMYTKIANNTLNLVAQREPRIAEGIAKYGAEATAKEWVSLRSMIEAANKISESCLTKEWQFFVPHPEVKLITSDDPVYFSLPHSNGKIMAGPTHPAAEIIVNLRPNLALVCTPPQTGESFNTYSLDKVNSRRFNTGTARAAQNQIYASQNLEGLSKLAKKYKDESLSIFM